MSRPPFLTLIVCTYDRADLLARCLQSLAAQDTSDPEVEFLVVDNNSTDRTPAVTESFKETLRGLRYCFEAEQGLSAARNRGWREAGGEYLLYLDDDAVAPPHYLRAVLKALRERRPDVLGGPVLPLYKAPRPWWFRDEYETRRYAERSGFIDSCRASGGNFAIRRRLLGELGLFDTALGMVGGVVRLGEERAVLERYRDQTPPELRRAWYDLDCYVLHDVPAHKMRFGYFISRYYESGRSSVRAKGKKPVTVWKTLLRALPLAAWVLTDELRVRGWRRADYLKPFLSIVANLGNAAELLRGGLWPAVRPLPRYIVRRMTRPPVRTPEKVG